ncbi:MAG: type VI secretion system-associated protein TagF [Pseudomonadota bacterium]
MPEQSLTGIYGKLPSHGDFVSHNLDSTFVDCWDEWLRSCLFASREQLGEQWLGTYLESPVWRFAIDAEIAGPMPIAGVMLPSVDAVGRYFPFTLAAPPLEGTRAASLRKASAWYDSASAVALTVLNDGFDLTAFLEEIGALEPLRAEPLPAANDVWLAEATDAGSDLLGLVKPCCLFWTDGSPQVEAGMLVSSSLPSPDRFAFMLGGGA